MIFESRSFSLGQQKVQIEPNSILTYFGSKLNPVQVDCRAKNFCYSLLVKKLVFHTEICNFCK